MNNLDQIAKELYTKIIQTYEDNQDMLMREAFSKHTSEYNDKETDELWGIMIDKMNASINPSGYSNERELSDFEKEVNSMYKEFMSSKTIESLSESINKLKNKIDYFEKHKREEQLVMPIRDYQSINLELDHLKYGLGHWNDIKDFIVSTSSKQVDIQKGLNLDKQKLSTFFYMMDKLGFVKKENIKNRVYIEITVD